MWKSSIIFLSLILFLSLYGCTQNSDNVQIDNPNESASFSSANTYKGEITLDFAFGPHTGEYDGEVNKEGMPDGIGKFTSKNDDGEDWTYIGSFSNGHFEGQGTKTFADGTSFTGEYNNDIEKNGKFDYGDGTYFEGDYTDSFNANGIYTDKKNQKFYAKLIDGNIEKTGVYKEGGFGNELDKYQGKWVKTDSEDIYVIVSGESINFVYDFASFDRKRTVLTFYFAFDENGKLIVVNEHDQPTHNIKINSDGLLSIDSISNYVDNELYKKISDNIEVPKEIKRRSPKIGMTAEEVLDSTWGSPKKVNKTQTTYGISEQWVYNNGYIYLENGVVTAIQS